jgi:large subunit ribosomal protein L35
MMPKMKTHKGAAKRFELTKNGKLMRMRAGHNHFRRNRKQSLNSDTRHMLSATVKSTVKMLKQIAATAVQR